MARKLRLHISVSALNSSLLRRVFVHCFFCLFFTIPTCAPELGLFDLLADCKTYNIERERTVMGVDNRKNKRIPFIVDVLINDAVLIKGIDISKTGLYVHTGRSFPVGSRVNVTFSLNAIKISVEASVQHNQSGVGMGLKFANLHEKEATLINQFIENFDYQKQDKKPGKKQVMLFDENDISRRMNKRKFVMEGFIVIEVDNGIDAINMLKNKSPGLIILDVFMQKIDGFKVLAIIKQSPKWKDVPVIIFSTKGTQDVIEKAMDAGDTEFLLKMVTTPVKLSETVKGLLG